MSVSKDEEKELLDIADHLVGTLGDMPADKADSQVAAQVERIYKLLGYDVKTFHSTDSAATKIRLCFRKDLT